MDENKSLILINPDAIQRCLVGEIERKLNQRVLRIVRKKEVVLTKEIIRILWPNISRQTTLKKLFSYLEGHIAPIWLIEGDKAVRKTLEIKKEMRERYCIGRLYSLLHCPDARKDFEREFKILFGDH